MERLWTAVGTATLVIAAIALNAFRYPAVSEMVGPAAAPTVAAEKPAPATQPAAPAPPPAWTSDFAPVAPSSPPSLNTNDAPATAPLPAHESPIVPAAPPAISPTPDPSTGALNWPAAAGAPPRDVRDARQQEPGATPKIVGFRAEPPQPEAWTPAREIQEQELVPIERRPRVILSGTSTGGNGVQRLPPVAEPAPRTVEPLPQYPTAGR